MFCDGLVPWSQSLSSCRPRERACHSTSVLFRPVPKSMAQRIFFPTKQKRTKLAGTMHLAVDIWRRNSSAPSFWSIDRISAILTVMAPKLLVKISTGYKPVPVEPCLYLNSSCPSFQLPLPGAFSCFRPRTLACMLRQAIALVYFDVRRRFRGWKLSLPHLRMT